MTAQTITITYAEGNTYPVKEYLKAAGFEWTGNNWIYRGVFDTNIWTSKYARIGWNQRRAAIACQAVTFDVRTIVAF